MTKPVKSISFLNRIESLHKDILAAARDRLKILLVKTGGCASFITIENTLAEDFFSFRGGTYNRIGLRDNSIVLHGEDGDSSLSEWFLGMNEAYGLLCTFENLDRGIDSGAFVMENDILISANINS